MRDVEIRGNMIRLGQLLQLAELADSGGDARELLRAGAVSVNGDRDDRRGRQLHRGDVVSVGDRAVRVA
jgi:ribosome-associated protein